MRFPYIFLGLFCITAGFMIATAVWQSQAVALGTTLEEFLPPGAIFNYQPSLTGIMTFLGDFVWGLAMTIEWLGKTPFILAKLMAAFGVPEVIANVISTLTLISFAGYIIYLIAGRIVW